MGSDNPDIQLVCFSLGEKLFAVDIMRIREITFPQGLSDHPGKVPIPEGIINLRGVLIPVMNMRKRFAMPMADDCAENNLLIVISLARQSLALEVDNAMGIITVPAREIYAPMNTVDGIGVENLLGVCISDNRVFMVLDIDSLLGLSEVRDVLGAPSD